MLTGLRDGHRRVPVLLPRRVLPETLRRHFTRPQAIVFTAEHMSGWHATHGVLGWPGELALPASARGSGAIVCCVQDEAGRSPPSLIIKAASGG